MADITDPQVVKFSNERLRPLARRVLELFNDVAATEAEWNGFIFALISGNDGADVLDDNRQSQGVSILDKDDISLMVTRLGELKDVLDVAFALDVVQKVKVGG